MTFFPVLRTLGQSLLCAVVCCICFGDASGTVDTAKSCAEVMFAEEPSSGHVSRALCWKCHPDWQKVKKPPRIILPAKLCLNCKALPAHLLCGGVERAVSFHGVWLVFVLRIPNLSL